MSEYVSNCTLPVMAEHLHAAQRIALTSHARPDGDAMGSVLALARVLEGLGKRAEIFLVGPIEPPLRAIAGATPFHLVESRMPGDDYDCIVIADTGAWSQVDRLADWIRSQRPIVHVFDHHAFGDDIGAHRYVDAARAATAQILIELFDAMDCPLTPGVAEALFVGLATDTGWFRFPSAGAEAFEDAARLLALEVDKGRLYRLLEETARPARLALEARALQSLEYVHDGRVAIMALRGTDFEATGGSLEDLTSMVNAPMVVGSVRASVMLVEREPEVTKVSLRSKPADPGGDGLIDVNALARRLGGGGHVHAAGAQMAKSVDETRAAVIEALGG